MSDDKKPKFVPTTSEPGALYHDDADGLRAQIEPHYTIDHGRPYYVQPAIGVGVGELGIDDGANVPFIRMNASETSNALVYIMTVGEMRMMAKEINALADKVEEAAAAAVPEAFRRKPGA